MASLSPTMSRKGECKSSILLIKILECVVGQCSWITEDSLKKLLTDWSAKGLARNLLTGDFFAVVKGGGLKLDKGRQCDPNVT